MNIVKAIFKNRASRIWFIVTVSLLVIFTVVSVVASTAFFDILGLVMPGGGKRAVYAEGVEPIYTTEYRSKKEVHEAARKFNIELSGEGMVLLQNKNDTLPIYTPESTTDKKTGQKPKISVFGKNSDNIAFGGSGSGGTDAEGAVALYAALEQTGYELNPELKAFYKSDESGPVRAANSKDLDKGDSIVLLTAETPQSRYIDTVKNSYKDYKDAAVVVFTRIGGEGFDLPRIIARDKDGVPLANDEDDHFLQLDKNELALLDAVCAADFKKVIILLNTGNAMQLDFLQDPAYDKVGAVVWMGFPGENGALALGGILNGTVNPSGKTTDTYAADFTEDPTWENFGDNRVVADSRNGVLGGDQYSLNGKEQLYYFVDYEESIYVGYKYYETKGLTDGKEWYDKNVIYPFGYGLSYTSFAWEIEDMSGIASKTIEKNQTYTVKVKVTNTGGVAGKEVVQLYGNAPFFPGQIEKSHVTLLDFAKTKLIEPDGSDIVELEFDPYYLASYDYKDQNNNQFSGFELDAGDYNLFVSRDAHEKAFTIPFTSPNIQYPKDPVTNADVVNRYTDQPYANFNSDTQLSVLLSRTDWKGTWPTTPDEERYVDQAFIDSLKDVRHNNPTKFGSINMPFSGENYGLKLRDLLFDDNTGEPINTDEDGVPHIDYDDDRWEMLLDQAVVSEMIDLYEYAAYKTNPVGSIGLPKTSCADGPVGWRSFMDKATFYDTVSYCVPIVIASTWNKKLIEDFGKMVGDEGIIGNSRGDGMPYSGWYAPGANIHRSPFGGRNFEYMSEDGLLTGKMTAAQIRGAHSKGVACFIKHFALNDQETHRSLGGNCSWVTEQAMREIYLRGFEIAVKEGGTRAVMSSFNRIGTRWAGGDYRLLTDILRNEWGFKGAVICDFNTIPQYMNNRQMAYAGGDLNLRTAPMQANWCNTSSAADVYILRQCVKNTAYTLGNSNAMNGEIIGYKMPVWQIVLIVLDCVIVAGLAVWGFFSIRGALKKSKETI